MPTQGYPSLAPLRSVQSSQYIAHHWKHIWCRYYIPYCAHHTRLGSLATRTHRWVLIAPRNRLATFSPNTFIIRSLHSKLSSQRVHTKGAREADIPERIAPRFPGLGQQLRRSWLQQSSALCLAQPWRKGTESNRRETRKKKNKTRERERERERNDNKIMIIKASATDQNLTFQTRFSWAQRQCSGIAVCVYKC